VTCDLHPEYDGVRLPQNHCTTCWDIFDITNRVKVVDGQKFMPNDLPIIMGGDGKWTLGAPQWLKDRMEALEKLPPPTLEQVHAQFEASKRFRRENARCRKHADYDKQNPPTTNCYGCWSAYTDFQQTNEAVTLFWQAMDKYGSMEGE
jgi:hypothetical protein